MLSGEGKVRHLASFAPQDRVTVKTRCDMMSRGNDVRFLARRQCGLPGAVTVGALQATRENSVLNANLGSIEPGRVSV